MDISSAVKLAKAGDNNGYAYLYNQTYQKSYYVALKFLKNEQNAMDVLQDSYIKAFKSLDQLQDPEKFESWLAKIVATRSLNELKKNNPVLFARNDEDDNFLESFEDDRVDTRPDIAIDRQETARLINEMLADLSEEQRVCITMFYMQEMSVKEIAEVLGVSENTVKSRLNYGRNKIKDKVLELEKKGTKLYGLLPMAFFLCIFKTEAMACEVTSPVFGEILKSVSSSGVESISKVSTASASSVKISAMAKIVPKAGFTIGSITLSAKALIAGITVVSVIGGGTVYGITKSNKLESHDEEQIITETHKENEASDSIAMESEGIVISETDDLFSQSFDLINNYEVEKYKSDDIEYLRIAVKDYEYNNSGLKEVYDSNGELAYYEADVYFQKPIYLPGTFEEGDIIEFSINDLTGEKIKCEVNQYHVLLTINDNGTKVNTMYSQLLYDDEKDVTFIVDCEDDIYYPYNYVSFQEGVIRFAPDCDNINIWSEYTFWYTPEFKFDKDGLIIAIDEMVDTEEGYSRLSDDYNGYTP